MLKSIIILPIKFYQEFISCHFPPRCKYFPACSDYSIGAVKKYGALIGLAKSVWRIARCNPFSSGGVELP